MDEISAIPLFLAVAEDRSFSGAARRLGLSSSAVGKAIARLEDQLGAALFLRTTRRVSLTSEGELLVERARRIHEAWQETKALLKETEIEPAGRLRIAMPAIGHRLIAPHLQAFRERYPRITLDLDLDDRIVELVAARIDIAIRSGLLDDSEHRSRRLGDFRFVLCATRAYLDANGAPDTISDLRQHAQIRFRHPGTERLQPWRMASCDDAAKGNPVCICTSMEGVLSSVVTGLGIAQMPDFLAAPYLRSGEFASILDEHARQETFWLVWPRSGHRSPKLRAFIDFCIGRLLV